VRASAGSIVDAVEPQIRVLLAEFPDMPTSVIMERVRCARGKTVFFERVAHLRPLFRPADPASRTEYQPGELAQCDLWFPPADVPLGWGQAGRPPVLVMVSGYSRVIAAVIIPSRNAPGIWRPRSCQAGRSARRLISTPSWRRGWCGRISVSTAGWAAARLTSGKLTRQRCWRCRRWRR
jgi:hypothetical protein